MDLILLQPGDTSLFPAGDNSWSSGGSLISGDTAQASTHDFKLGQCMELVSVHQGIKHEMTGATDLGDMARTSGRPVITEFTCTKYVDKTSVKMYDFCLRAQSLGGKENPSCLYILRNSGDKITNVMTFMLRDALISEIQFQSHPDDMPTEQFKLNFTEILWTYTVQTPDIQTKASIATGWSLARNLPISAFT